MCRAFHPDKEKENAHAHSFEHARFEFGYLVGAPQVSHGLSLLYGLSLSLLNSKLAIGRYFLPTSGHSASAW